MANRAIGILKREYHIFCRESGIMEKILV